MRQQLGPGGARPWVTRGALVCALAVVVLAGTVKAGHASATNPLTSTFSVLNDVSATIKGQPTPGGNIGYDLAAQATGGNTVNHVTLTESIGPKGKVVLINATGIACSGLNTTTLSCSAQQLSAGASFDVIVLFKTDSAATPGSTVTNTVVGSFDPQTPNQSNNRKTDTFGPGAVSRTYAGAGDGSLTQSLALGAEGLTAGGLQTSTLTMPPGFLNNFNYVGSTLQNLNGASATPPSGCGTCIPFETQIVIPTASTFGTAGPFLNAGLTTKAFGWTITVPGSLLPQHFTPTGVWHTDNNGGNGGYLPICAHTSSGLPVAPTTAPGLCVDTITQSATTGTVVYSGLGVNNGSSWAG